MNKNEEATAKLYNGLKKDNLQTVEEALAEGADVNRTSLSVKKAEEALAKETDKPCYLDNPLHLDRYYDTPITFALQYCSDNVVERLINNENIDLSKPASDGRYSPVLFALMKGRYKLAIKMVEKGADIHFKDSDKKDLITRALEYFPYIKKDLDDDFEMEFFNALVKKGAVFPHNYEEIIEERVSGLGKYLTGSLKKAIYKADVANKYSNDYTQEERSKYNSDLVGFNIMLYHLNEKVIKLNKLAKGGDDTLIPSQNKEFLAQFRKNFMNAQKD